MCDPISSPMLCCWTSYHKSLPVVLQSTAKAVRLYICFVLAEGGGRLNLLQLSSGQSIRSGACRCGFLSLLS